METNDYFITTEPMSQPNDYFTTTASWSQYVAEFRTTGQEHTHWETRKLGCSQLSHSVNMGYKNI